MCVLLAPMFAAWTTLVSAQVADGNDVANDTESFLSTTPSPIYDLTGFATLDSGTTGGGVIPETDPAYRKVSTPLEFAEALHAANKNKGVKVIEIMNDLDLGWNEIGPEVRDMASTPFTSAIPAKLHPVLLRTGVSSITINPKTGGLTIFSANGAAIRHCIWNIKATCNIIIRNLTFDELWEWDEESKGDYDKNNWDFLTLGVGGGTVHHVWIDHCTFTKAYDGIIDTKGGACNVTYSWNKYVGDDGATDPNSFVRLQIDALEADMTAYPMYHFLRTRGFDVEDIVQIMQGPGKLHAIGELSLHPDNANSTVTFHHQWYINAWDRLPRLAGGMVHNYNIYVDDTGVLAARRLRDSIAATMSAADQKKLNDTYNFKPPINGSISTENGAMLVEKSVYIDCNWPLRNNQTDPDDPIYTGKIKAEDSIYIYHEANGDVTCVRGDSTDPDNPLGPFQAPVIPFSWNTSDGQRPYPPVPMDDPNELEAVVTSPTAGAGAGVLRWEKSNWLKTSYELPPAPAWTSRPRRPSER
jgi:pectate lyase